LAGLSGTISDFLRPDLIPRLHLSVLSLFQMMFQATRQIGICADNKEED